MGRDRDVNRRHFIMTGLATMAWPMGAAGYLLPSHQLIDYTNRRLAKVRGLEVALVGETRTATGPVNIGERWGFQGGMQVDVKGPEGRQAQWRVGGKEEGYADLLPRPAIRAVLHHLFGQADLARLLLTIGADERRQRLALSGERVAHVLGAASRRDQTPQVWIQQDSFEILRVRFRGPNGPLDLRLDDWAGPVTEGHFPHQIKVFEGGRWVRRLETDAVQYRR